MPISLTAVRRRLSVNENDVQATPVALDADLVFTSTTGSFRGSITVAGLAAGDVVRVANQGTGPGQIGLSGNAISYEGALIGFLSGGNGTTLALNITTLTPTIAIDALLQALTFSTADAPAATRTLVIAMSSIAGETLGLADVPASFSATALPPGLPSAPDLRIGLGDYDNDGDADAVIYTSNAISLFRNDGGTYNFAATLAGAPSGTAPRFVDFDTDGDLDIVAATGATLTAYRNTAGAFALVSSGSPFAAISSIPGVAPAFGDIDADGDADLVLGVTTGPLRTFINTAGSFGEVTGAANPLGFIGGAGTALQTAFVDFDRDGRDDLVVRDPAGLLGVFRNTASGFVRDYAAVGAFGAALVAAPGQLSFGDFDNDGAADLIVGTTTGSAALRNDTPRGVAITITVTPQPEGSITGLDAVTFGENAVNAAPQLIDADVSFTTTYSGTSTGSLTVSGLLAEDQVGIRTLGSGSGQFAISGSALRYEGNFIGNVSGGIGTPLTVMLPFNVTGAVIDALIQNLTYRNGSDAPTASRTLVINVTDPAGDLGPVAGAAPRFTEAATIDEFTSGAIALVDLDADSDLDIVRISSGPAQVWLNQGAGGFALAPGVGLPFNGISFTPGSRPVFGDIDGDGDLDLVIGDTGMLRAAVNNDGVFTEAAGAANPFGGVTFSALAVPAFVDFDRDGDLDLVVGSNATGLRAFRRDGTTWSERVGADNPFFNDGLANQRATAIDFDGDGDRDLLSVSGSTARLWQNTLAGFTPVSADRNPFAGLAPSNILNLAAGDVSGDGEVDLIFAGSGSIRTFTGNVPRGAAVTVTVTPESDSHSLTGLRRTFAIGENDANAGRVIDSDVVFVAGPGGLGPGTRLTVTGLLAEDSLLIPFQGIGAGQFSVSGNALTYGGQIVASILSQGIGTSLSVVFNNPFPETPIETMIDALIQSLVYRNSSNTPIAQRTLTFNITDSAGNDLGVTAGRPAITELDGPAIPLTGAGVNGAIAFADLDGDGDIDALGITGGGATRAAIRTASGFLPFSVDGNPLSSVTIASQNGVGFGDIDGDGDLDAVFGGATLRVFRNIGDGFQELTGAANPLGGFAFSGIARPAFGDFDGDGDSDLVVGSGINELRAFRNTGGTFAELTGSANPFAALAGAGSNIAAAFRDIDGNGTLDVAFSTNNQIFLSRNIGGTYQSPELLIGNVNAISLAFADVTGDGESDLIAGTTFGPRVFQLATPRGANVTVTVAPQIERPRIDELDPLVNLTVKPLHPAPQLIDANVTYTAPGSAFGTRLTISGLFVGDEIGWSEANGFALNGNRLTRFGGQVGTVTTSPGAIEIQFANGSPFVIDQTIKNLTYTNNSLTPTIERTLSLAVTNADGLTLAPVGGEPVHTSTTPLSFGLPSPGDQLSGGDVDGDGDIDFIIGTPSSFRVLRNDGGSFTEVGNVLGLNVSFGRIAIADLDLDGDLDRLVASNTGVLRLFENRGGLFAERTGGGSPFTGITIAGASPTFGDIDADGDVDIVIGTAAGGLRSFVQGADSAFTELTGGANPFAAITAIPNARPVLIDRNNDGALDLFIGSTATARAFAYTPGGWVETAAPPNLTQGVLFDGDGDDDIDLFGTVSGNTVISAFSTSLPPGSANVALRLTVVWNQAPSGTDARLTLPEDGSRTLAIGDFGFVDPDGDLPLAVVIATLPGAGLLQLDGTPVTQGQIVPVTSIAAGLLRFVPGPDGAGIGYASFTFQVRDDGGTANDGQDTDQTANMITFDVTAVNDAPVISILGEQLTRLGGEVRVNAATAGDQADPAITRLAGGDVVVVWTSPDADSTGIFMQRFTAAGTAVGGEVRVNATTAGEQIDSAVVGLAGGGYVVAWTSTTVDSRDIFLQMFDATGAPVGGELRANSTVFDDQQQPAIAALSSGGFVVVWEADGQDGFGWGIYGQMFDGSGARVGGETRINVTTTADQRSPDVIAMADGGYQVVWTSPDSSGNGVYRRIFSADGSADAERRINTTVLNDQEGPVAASMTGGFVNLWTANVMPGGNLRDIVGRHAHERGSSGEFFVNGGLVGNQIAPDVIGLANSGYAAVWQSINQDGSGSGIYAARHVAPGGGGEAPQIGGEFPVNITTAGDQTAPAVADLGGGSFVVAWQSAAQDGDGAGIYLQRIGPSYAATEQTSRSLKGGYALSDADAGSGVVTATLAVGFGILTVTTGTSGATLVSGDGTATVVLGGTIAQIQNLLNFDGTSTVIYTPNGDAPPATTTFTVTIDDGGNSGGVAQIGSASSTIIITAVNDAPVGTSATVTIDEDATRTLTAADFGYSDVDGNALAAVVITTLSGAGALTLGGVAVTAGQSVTAAQLATNQLVFTPAADANGSTYASFTFQVQDDGGTADGGVDLDQSADTLTFDVTAVNDAPVHSLPATLTVVEDDAVFFSGGIFIDPTPIYVSDPDSATITTRVTVADGVLEAVPAGGVNITGNNSNDLTATGSVAAINFLLYGLKYTPAANVDTPRTITVTTSDGTGSDTDTINVTIIGTDDPPAGADITLTAIEDVRLALVAANFGFSDPDSGDTLSAIRVTTAPAIGRLVNIGYQTGQDVTGDGFPDIVVIVPEFAYVAGDVIDPAHLAAGLVFFEPGANDNGSAADSFTFQVIDDSGSTASQMDPTPRTMTFDVTPVSDAPEGLDGFITLAEDEIYTFCGCEFGFFDLDGEDFAGVVVTTLSDAGRLLLAGAAIAAGTFVTADDIDDGLLTYVPGAEESGVNYASFTFQVRDDGDTGNGGVITDPTPRTLEIDVIEVNDPPTIAAPASFSGNEDVSFALTGIIISEPEIDPALDVITVRLSVASGGLQVADDVAGGLDPLGIDGNGGGTVTLYGTLDQINATLAAAGGLTYRGDPDFSGADALTITAIDGEICGCGGIDFLDVGGGGPLAMPITALLFGELDGEPGIIFGGVLSLDPDAVSGAIGVFGPFGGGVVPVPGLPVSLLIGEVDGLPGADILFAAAASPIGSGLVGYVAGTDGSFTSIAALGDARDLVAADFDGDGRTDYAALDIMTPQVAILLRDAAAGFLPTRFETLSLAAPTALAVGDMDGDGIADLVVAGAVTGRPGVASVVTILIGNGDGSFDAPAEAMASAADVTDLLVSDVDGDGRADLVVATSDASGAPGSVSGVTVLLGGDRGFSAPLETLLAPGANPISLVAADFNADRFVDIAVTTGSTDPDALNALVILPGLGDGSFMDAVEYELEGFAPSLAAGDIDVDGDPDLLLGYFTGDGIGIFLNDSPLRSSQAVIPIAVAAVDDPFVADADTAATPENAPATILVLANDIDVDGGAPALITHIAGQAVSAGGVVTLPSGATATLNADGSITYDPNGRFVTLTDNSSGAVNISATDSFGYALGGGGSATVTVTINGVAGPGDELRGDSTPNTIDGTARDDMFVLNQSASPDDCDTAKGLAGSDGFFLGAAFGTSDDIDGGADADQLGLRGTYDLAISGTMLRNVETIALLSGTDASFGGPTGPTSYILSTADDVVAGGELLILNGNGLLAAESFTFDGSAESDGAFRIFGGFGSEDLTGGAQSDGFFFGAGRFGAGDGVDGGGGSDNQLALRGNYTLDFNAPGLAGAIANIQTIALISATDPDYMLPGDTAFDYSLTLSDGLVGAGALLTINGNGLSADETMIVDGSGEASGTLRLIGGDAGDTLTGGGGNDLIFGGLGADLLTGNGGADSFRYFAAAQSTAAQRDTIVGFDAADLIDLSGVDAIEGGGNDAFAFIGGAAFGGIAGQLRLVQQGSEWLIEGDTDGDGVADLVIGIQPASGYEPVLADLIL